MAGGGETSSHKKRDKQLSRQESNRSGGKGRAASSSGGGEIMVEVDNNRGAGILTAGVSSSSASSSGGAADKTSSGLRVYKIVVLGDGGVGKSAVTLQFVNHSFLDYHDPTIEDSYQKQAVIDGEPALLDILDTAGQVEFTAMRDQYMRCGEGFLICYSVTDRHSFQEAVEYRKLIQKVRASEENTPLVLVGNKFDLQLQRKVTTEEGRTLAHQFACPFYETSAALRTFVDDAFHTLVREIRIKEREKLDLLASLRGTGDRKLNQTRHHRNNHHHSKWWRLRSIFALVFKRKRYTNTL